MRHLIHRASFIGCVVCLVMIPIGITVKAMEWGEVPSAEILGYFAWAWVFAIFNYVTRR